MKQRVSDRSLEDAREFLSSLAHDLRNLLEGVALAYPSLGEGSDRESFEATYRSIFDIVRRAEDYRDTMQRRSSNAGRAEVDTVLKRAVRTLRPFLRDRDVACQCPEGLEAAVHPVALERLLEAMLHLVARRTRKGGVEIAVARRAGNIEISVDGPPLAAHEGVASLFSEKPSVEGSLWASRDAARSYGGELHCRALPRGTGVYLRVPAAEGVQEASVRPGRERKRVLLVDDDADGGQGLAMLLRAAGFETRTCTDGNSGFATAKAFQPHVVIVDLVLPDIDGFELCRRIRQQQALAGAFVIAVSGRADDEVVTELREAGFDEFFLKPVGHDQLIAALKR